MHLPKLYKSEDFDLLKDIIQNNSFASLISYHDKILSTKAMMQMTEVAQEKFIIETHISRADPIARKIKDGDQVLCDFLGIHSYISSSWYNHTNVSTWNYEEVQIYGAVEIMSDDELYQHLKKLTDYYELPQKCPMTLEKMGSEFVSKEMKGALGLKIVPSEVSIKQKLSQNRDNENYQRIIDNLNQSPFPNDKIMAKKMADLKNNAIL